MKTVGRKELTEAIASETGLTQTDVRVAIDGFIEHVKKQFREGHMVEIRQFGTFFPHRKKPRSYKVPKTGEVRVMPGRITMKFKASKFVYIFDKGAKNVENSIH
jgi:nucleoid DNA-binding protein